MSAHLDEGDILELRALILPRGTGRLGDAGYNLASQLPAIAETFPEVGGCHRGTINIALERDLVVVDPHGRTGPVRWQPRPPHPPVGEPFDFLRVDFALDSEVPVWHRAWFYVPRLSPHRRTPHIHEVLLEQFLPGVEPGGWTRVRLNAARVR
jgi:hypothetical protein